MDLIKETIRLKHIEKMEWKDVTYTLNKMYNLSFSIDAYRKRVDRFLSKNNKDINDYIAENFDVFKEDTKPKILIFDIETAPILGYVWGLWDNTLGLNQVESDWYVLSWSAKWLGDSEDNVMYADQRNAKDIEDDKELLKGIWNLLNEADIVVTQNGRKFDVKKLNARFILNGMHKPSHFRHIDTKILASRHFAFTSNKLEYLTNKLCTKYKKLKHAKFSGFELWKQCLKGNLNAWNEMEEYNKYDVLSLEELYTKLIGWDADINMQIYSKNFNKVCNCGYSNFKENGFYITNTAKYKKFVCLNCGLEHRENKNLLTKEQKQKIIRFIK